jgi:o-succinylbenzoate synthase
MKIQNIEIGQLSTPLKRPFRTSRREVLTADEIVIKIHTEHGEVGWGSAHPTPGITGDTFESTIHAIKEILGPRLIGQELFSPDRLCDMLDATLPRNSSPKAALDMALHDLFGKKIQQPLWKILGGARRELHTDITVSLDTPDKMAQEAREYIEAGFKTLKVKIGSGEALDIERVKAVREAVGPETELLLDANQGWEAEEAIRTIQALEQSGIDMKLVEQPVKASDIDGLRLVTSKVKTDILADESVCSPKEAEAILRSRSADMLNVKLMKSGGLCNAARIATIAERAHAECMMGCMIESHIGVTAAAHLAAGRSVFKYIDLDPPLLLAGNPVRGGVTCNQSLLTLPDAPGLGIEAVEGLTFI